MKTNILIVAALAFSVNAIAQNSCPMEREPQTTKYSEDKMESMYQNVANNHVSYIDPAWETGNLSTIHYRAATAIASGDCYKMIDHTMFTIKDGAPADMPKYMTVKNGSVVLINGVVITSSGKVLRLKNGDSIDMQGLLIRNQESGSEAEVAKL